MLNQKCYASQLQKVFNKPLYSFQRALDRLEKGGVLISYKEGKTLLYQFNPRYPFLLELTALLKKAYEFLPKDLKEKYTEIFIAIQQTYAQQSFTFTIAGINSRIVTKI